MRLVDKHILRELVEPFLFGVAAFTSVFFAGAHMLKLTQALMKGMPLLDALQVVVLCLPNVMFYTLPMGTLLAVLLGIGRLSSDSEVTALFAGGVSIYRLAVPVMAVGLAVSVLAIGLNECIAPQATSKYQMLLNAALQQESRSDKSFVLRDESSQSVINIDGIDPETGTLKNVTITQFSDKKPSVIVYADRARWEGLKDRQKRYQWKLYDGYATALGDTTDTTKGSVTVCFKEKQTSDISKTPQELEQFQKKPDEMSFMELSRLIKHLKDNPTRTPERVRQLDVDRWNKIAFPFSGLVFAMLAAPLAIRPMRSSSSVGLGLSILLILAYWLTWHYTSQLAIQGSVDPFVGAFAADVLGIGVAIALLKRAAK